MKIEIFSFVMGMVLMLVFVIASLVLGVSVAGAADRRHKKLDQARHEGKDGGV